MATYPLNLEAMYALLTLEEEEGSGVVAGESESEVQKPRFVLVGKFLT